MRISDKGIDKPQQSFFHQIGTLTGRHIDPDVND